MEQDNLAAGSVTTAKIVNGNVTAVKIDQSDDFTWTGTHDFTGATVSGAYTATAANALAGSVVQVVNYQTGALASGSTTIPDDDTIPQNTEGNEYMTLAITPKSATNKLRIDVVGNFSGLTEVLAVALFQDSTANALASTRNLIDSGNSITVSFIHYMTAGTTSETTFKVRAGVRTGTTYLNGSSTRKHGGVMASSITITEIKV